VLERAIEFSDAGEDRYASRAPQVGELSRRRATLGVIERYLIWGEIEAQGTCARQNGSSICLERPHLVC
jgi:hypothetical protein